MTDYKDKYLSLKNQITNSNYKIGDNKLNPLLLEQLTNMSFVANGKILGNDITAIILSLINDFNIICNSKIYHNLEISQYYSNKNNKVISDNYEIVLKYIDSSLCVTNINHNTNKLNGETTCNECSISRGVVQLFLKKTDGNNIFTYTKIDVIHVHITDILEKYYHTTYQKNSNMQVLDNLAGSVLSKMHGNHISSMSHNGYLETNTPNDILNTVSMVNSTIEKIKLGSINPQLSKISINHISDIIPTSNQITVATIVGEKIMSLNKNNDLVVLLVPGNEPIPIQIDPVIESVYGSINPNGTKTHLNHNQNTLNSKLINCRASIEISANIVVASNNSLKKDPLIKLVEIKNLSTEFKNNSSINAFILPANEFLRILIPNLKHCGTLTLTNENNFMPAIDSENTKNSDNMIQSDNIKYTNKFIIDEGNKFNQIEKTNIASAILKNGKN